MHVVDPVAQAVHDELQHVRMTHVQRVARPRVVHVVAPVVRHEPVVRRVVDALEREHGPEVVPFGRVVVHHVEDHFDARGVQRLDELLELLHLLAALAGGRVLVVGGKIADGVVAPVVAQAPLGERRVLDELVDRQQLHGGDAKLRQVLDSHRMRHAGVGAAQRLGYVRMRLAEPFHVRLVDDRAVQRGVGRAVVAPVERRVDHHALGDERHAVENRWSSFPAHRSDTGTSPRSSPTSRRPPWRTDRAAASRDCTTAPSRAPRDRAPGNRSAAPAGRPASTRASTRPCFPADRRASAARPRRTGRARRAQPLPRTGRSSCPRRRRTHRGDTACLARSAFTLRLRSQVSGLGSQVSGRFGLLVFWSLVFWSFSLWSLVLPET